MTCAHVLGLLDAGSLAEYPPTHMEAARQHARQCASCGPALRAAEALTAGLAALPKMGPSPAFAATVLARIAQTEPLERPARAAALPATRPGSLLRECFASVAAPACLVAGLALILSMVSGDEVRTSITSTKVGGMGLLAMPSTFSDAVVLGTGLLLYAAGLLAPLSGRDRS